MMTSDESDFNGGLSAVPGKAVYQLRTITRSNVWWRPKRKRGAQSLEACMASSISQARQGTLYLMCGRQDRSLISRAKPNSGEAKP